MLRTRALVVALIVVFATLFGIGGPHAVLASHPAAPSLPLAQNPANTSLKISTKPVGTVPANFWGLNVRVEQKTGTAQRSYVTSTPVKMIRWPGGNLGERYNMTANGGAGLLYNDSGSTTVPPWTTAQFVTWCESFNCRTIFTVPAEIDRPSLAASYVTYVEVTLGFHPTYWEIGNEPALWDHFGVTWNQWNTSQDIEPTPAEYASVVNAYVSVMRLVDPNIQFIGLGGVGTGSEVPWITSTVSVNGPNISAIAIHVYPAGAGTVNETDAQVYSSVIGIQSLEYRIPHDLAAIGSACPSCHIQLIVDELNAAAGTNLTAFMSGFKLVPYVAAELEQGIYLNVSSMELFALEGGYAGSMFNASGGAHPISTLYSTILPHLDPVVLSANVTSALPNVYALASENTTGNLSTSLLIANLNSTLSARISLTGSGFPLNSSGTVWLWNTTSSAPVSQPLGLGASSGWVMPPESIGLWVSGKSVSGLHISLKATPPTIALGDSALLNASVAIGVPPYTYAWLGLPSGCVSKNASGLKCVPAVTGTFTVSVFVNDSAGDTGSSTAVLIVDHTLSITSFTATPSTLTLGQTTSLSVSLSGGVSPYSYTFTGLPTGCASADSASMSCKPSATGNYTVRSYVNDSARNSANRTVTLAVDALCLFCGALLAITPTSDTIATGEIANFAATETCTSSCPLGMTYSWSLTNSAAGSLNSSMGSSVTFTASGAIGTVGLFVNATLDGASMESSPAIITIMALTLTSVTVSPPQSTVGLGGTQTFRAIPTCSAACPSVGIAYSWSLSSNTGNISTTTGNATTFTAGNSVGSLSLLLSATLNGASENASASITIWAPALISVAVIPNSAVVVEGATSPQFKGTPTCNATCPSGIAYSWALTNGAMGILSTTTGPSVMFAAGNTPGEVTLFVNATLNGKTVYSSAAIAVTPAHPPSSGPTPLPSGITFLIFVGVMAAVVVIAAVLVLLRRRRAQPLPSVSAHEGL